MNIFSSQVVLTNASRPAARRYVWLIGGETKCVRVEPGRWSVQVRSTKLYDPSARNVNQCRSKTLVLVARAGEKLSLYVEPRRRGPAYVCGWKLRSVVQSTVRPNKSLHASRTSELLIENLRVSQLRAAA